MRFLFFLLFLFQYVYCEELNVYSKIITSKGELLFELFVDKTPLTTMNFVGLVEGKLKEVSNTDVPFYNGLKIDHKVPRSLLVLGCPQGVGNGDAGYFIPDEFDDSILYNSIGLLGMASLQDDKNSCRLFISLGDISYLKDQKTVFGKLIKGEKVLMNLEKGDVIKEIEILRAGKDAHLFSCDFQKWEDEKNSILLNRKHDLEKSRQKVFRYAMSKHKKIQAGRKGVRYFTVKEGAGEVAKMKESVSIRYVTKDFEGNLIEDEWEFKDRKFNVGEGRVPKVLSDAILSMKKNERRILYYYNAHSFRGSNSIKYYITEVSRTK